MDDLKKAGLYSVPITLIILIVVFGALVAAGIPLLLALTAVLATFGLWAIPSHIWPSDESLYAMILLIGLAVGVDYSMFYLKREREERAAGRSPEQALEIAAATSGRSVLVSGATVIIAMAGLLFAGEGFAPFGVATMLVVAVAMIGSLTVLPAVLSKLGDNVERLRVPFVHRRRRNDEEGRVWGAIVDRVLRRPALSAALSAGLLLLIAAPALTLHTAEPGIDTYPQALGVMKTYNRLQAAFPGTEIPANVVVKAADVNSTEIRNAIGELERRAVATGLMQQPIIVDVNEAGTVANVAVPIAGKGNDGPSNAALAALRDEIVPATIGAVPDTEVAVGGFAAESKDFNDYMKSVVWFVFAFVLGFAFLILLFAFRSLVIAAKAIVLNLLSVAAAYGILVLVFQHGWGKQLLGFESTGGIVPFLPIFLFVILFGLSMDYHVFILSRIREAYDQGMSTEQAVSHGIKTTAGVITSAALVMVCVFSVFGVLSFMLFKQIGVGLAAAILIDATIVRAVLLPATMKLLGDWNWYLPSWLEWLPHLEHGGSRRASRGSAGCRADRLGHRSVRPPRAAAAPPREDASWRSHRHTTPSAARPAPASWLLSVPNPDSSCSAPVSSHSTSSTTTSSSRIRAPPRATIWSAASCRLPCSSLPPSLYGRLRAGARGDDRAPARLLRRARRHGGRLLHASGRSVGRRLHGSAVGTRGPPAARCRDRHAVDVAARGRSAVVAVRPASPVRRRDGGPRGGGPHPLRDRLRASRMPCAPRCRGPNSGPPTRTSSSRRATA